MERVQLRLNRSELSLNDKGAINYVALINITQSWCNDTDNHQSNSIHALFIDFNKAFDHVDHSLLLTKLKNMNINPLSPNSDLCQTSHCNINGLSVSEVMRIENMITQVKFY